MEKMECLNLVKHGILVYTAQLCFAVTLVKVSEFPKAIAILIYNLLFYKRGKLIDNNTIIIYYTP